MLPPGDDWPGAGLNVSRRVEPIVKPLPNEWMEEFAYHIEDSVLEWGYLIHSL